MIVIIGAGISGLTAAHHLEDEYIILEKENYAGGLSTCYDAGGYRFDFGGHYFHFQGKEQIKQYLEVPGRFKEYRRDSKVFTLGRYIPFPVQYHLAYLPHSLGQTVLQEILQHTAEPRAASLTGSTLQEFLEQHFGSTLVDFFFKPFLGKYYGTNLTNLAADMDKGSIPVPDRETALQGAAGKKFTGTGYNPVFYYPKDSLRDFTARYAAPIAQKQFRGCSPIHLHEAVTAIHAGQKKVYTEQGEYAYDYLVNTMPLKDLLAVSQLHAHPDFPHPDELKHISTLVCNVVLAERRKRWHWVYLPERKFPFYRAGFYPGHKLPVAYLEKTVTAPLQPAATGTTAAAAARESLFDEILFTLKEMNIIRSKSEVLYFDARYIPVSYVLFDMNWRRLVPPLLERLKESGIYSTGRYGAWNYTSMSDDIAAAIDVAAQINKKQRLS